MLQQYVWNKEDGGDNLSIDNLWDLMTSNVYMHRLRHKTVLQDCIRQGVEQGMFGYAEGYAGDRYDGLRYGESMTAASAVVAERAPGFLVRPEVAARQKEAEQTETSTKNEEATRDIGTDDSSGSGGRLIPDAESPSAVRLPRRITARKTVKADISLDDINQLREEIIRNLIDDGGEITVEITVSARKPEGFSESITRSLRENSIQLGLEFTTSEEE